MSDIEIRHRPTSSSSVRPLAIALCLGLLAGTAAQMLRQGVGPTASLGGATAPWVTLGFIVGLLTVRRRSLADGTVWAAAVIATYLLAWLASYHALFMVREAVSLGAVWHEAHYWMVALAPASVGLGVVAACAARGGWLGDACLGLPIAWSAPEIVTGVAKGPAYVVVLSLPAAVLAVIPVLVCWRRHPRLLAVASVAAVAGTVVALCARFVGVWST